MTDYTLIFGAALLLNVILTFRSSDMYKKVVASKNGNQNQNNQQEEGITKDNDTKHTALLKKYLLVYLLATFSDWIQGPYVYELYSSYGYSPSEIAQLFVAGFGSSMIFGSFVGGIADWGGRRMFVMVFAITYAASCVTKREFVAYFVVVVVVDKRSIICID